MPRTAQDIARAVARTYLDRYGDLGRGLCAVVARDVIANTGGEPVGGWIHIYGGRAWTHWWVELDGQTLDPLGDQYEAEPCFGREVVVRGWGEAFEAALDDAFMYDLGVRLEVA